MKKNNQWRYHSKKKQSRNSDARKLDKIQNSITTLAIIREKEILDPRFSTRNHVRVPDFTINNTIFAEHDTYKIHGDLSAENERTRNRNKDYVITNRPYFVIHEDLAKQLGLDETALFQYLYYHTLSQYNAIQSVRDELGH